MNSERFSVQEEEQYRSQEQLIRDLEWFLGVSEDLTSNDAVRYARGVAEKDRNPKLFLKMSTEYGMEVVPEKLKQHIAHLKSKLAA